jgi:hypothetical protein
MTLETTNDTWSYRLTLADETTCVEIGFERAKPYFGNPQANRNYSEGDTWELHQHIVAVGSELAFARMIGLNDFVPHFNKWRTEQDVPGTEIKYCWTNTNPNYPDWSLRHHELDNPEHVYVLMSQGLEKKAQRMPSQEWRSPAYVALGWMYGHEARVSQYEQSASRYRTWRVPFQELRPMSQLDGIRNHNAGQPQPSQHTQLDTPHGALLDTTQI